MASSETTWRIRQVTRHQQVQSSNKSDNISLGDMGTYICGLLTLAFASASLEACSAASGCRAAAASFASYSALRLSCRGEDQVQVEVSDGKVVKRGPVEFAEANRMPHLGRDNSIVTKMGSTPRGTCAS